MENTKHIGYMWGLAVALGIGMAVAATPAVASADTGSESGDSSPSSSSDDSGATSSDTSSKKRESSATNDAENSSAGPRSGSESTKDADEEGDEAGRDGGTTSRPASDSAPEKTDPDPETEVDSTDDDSVATPESPASIVSTVIDGVTSPFAPSAPNEPVEPPAASALLTLSRRDVEPGSSTPSTTVDPPAAHVTNGLVVTDSAATSSEEDVSVAAEPDFVSSTRGFFGLFSITSAGDPSDDNYVAVVFKTPIFTIVLTSGTDPEDNLGLGAATIGVDGQTVATFISPFVTFSAGIPIEDPFAELFIDLIRAGII
jgi:hypothetical protein